MIKGRVRRAGSWTVAPERRASVGTFPLLRDWLPNLAPQSQQRIEQSNEAVSACRLAEPNQASVAAI
eukprot:2943412-Pyramimonas_sp.AAC.1